MQRRLTLLRGRVWKRKPEAFDWPEAERWGLVMGVEWTAIGSHIFGGLG